MGMFLVAALCSCESNSSSKEEAVQPKEENVVVEETPITSVDFSIELSEHSPHHSIVQRRSYRGMHVLSADELWMSGSKGTVYHLKGDEVFIDSIPGNENLDFRDIVAFDSNTALTITAGSPARIYKTQDGGQNWSLVYENTDSLIFFDAMEFWDDQRGIAMSDPIDDKLFLLVTEDGGESWSRIPKENLPEKNEIEAGFAASGTSIALQPGGKAWIGLGGTEARVYQSQDYGVSWKAVNTPMMQGNASCGIYSICFSDELHGVGVGGNWELHESDSAAIYTEDGGETWHLASGIGGYRSCVEDVLLPGYTRPLYVNGGTSGINISYDQGHSWNSLDTTNVNVIEAAPNSSVAWAADSYGHLYKLEFKHPK